MNLACLASLALAATSAASLPSIGLEDHDAVRTPGRPHASPDGTQIAYLLDDRVWVVPAEGGTARAVTAESSKAGALAWARDGSALYFLSDRGGSSQLWKLPVDRFGEAERLTNFERGVDALELSPDESRLLLVLGAPASETDGDGPRPPWVITRRQFKEDAGDGYLVAPPDEHLYSLDIASGALSPITSGEYAESDAAWSHDGRRVAFVSNREADPDLGYRSDLWIIDADAGGDMGRLERVTDDERVPASPRFSPDGRWLAWTSAADGVYGIYELLVRPAGGGEVRNLSAPLDRWISEFRWGEDGRWIYVVYDDHGGAKVARIRADDGRIERLLDDEVHVSALDVDARGHLHVRMSRGNAGPELHAVREGEARPLTAINEEFFASRRLGEKRKASYAVADGTVVETFVTTPPGYRPGERYPAVLKIHGGPVGQFAWGYDFGTQYLAANGYVVLEPNPRGSTGRGQAFVRAIYRSWGITDLPDVLGAVDHAVESGLADPDRLFVTGYSYGGYMTNVVITESTRFRAAASGAGHAHLVANYGHDIYQKWYNWEFGSPTENRELYDRLSPLLRADRVQTPTLFLGGREDWNVPILSSELFYQTLRTLGVDTQLVVYPDSHHGGWAASYEQDYLERMVGWFDRYDPGR